jgi:hypothetical protein
MSLVRLLFRHGATHNFMAKKKQNNDAQELQKILDEMLDKTSRRYRMLRAAGTHMSTAVATIKRLLAEVKAAKKR